MATNTSFGDDHRTIKVYYSQHNTLISLKDIHGFEYFVSYFQYIERASNDQFLITEIFLYSMVIQMKIKQRSTRSIQLHTLLT